MSYKLACEKKKNRIDNRKGSTGRRVIKTVNAGKTEFQYHATKGWRSYRR